MGNNESAVLGAWWDIGSDRCAVLLRNMVFRKHYTEYFCTKCMSSDKCWVRSRSRIRFKCNHWLRFQQGSFDSSGFFGEQNHTDHVSFWLFKYRSRSGSVPWSDKLMPEKQMKNWCRQTEHFPPAVDSKTVCLWCAGDAWPIFWNTSRQNILHNKLKVSKKKKNIDLNFCLDVLFSCPLDLTVEIHKGLNTNQAPGSGGYISAHFGGSRPWHDR